jgi:hypothetical protein
MLLAILTLLTALSISAVAAYFSIIGLAAIFAATYIPVIVMASTLEVGKLVAAAWLHRHWHESPGLLKTYLLSAVVVLMLITSIGIFGFLSKGHLEQALPKENIALQLTRIEQQLQANAVTAERYKNSLNQLDASIAALLQNNRVTQSIQQRTQQQRERADIQARLTQLEAQNVELQNQKLQLQTQNVEVQAKLGPLLYVAPLFGLSDLDGAVRLIIVAIMFAFDPVAIALLLAAQWSFMNRRRFSAPVSNLSTTASATLDQKKTL